MEWKEVLKVSSIIGIISFFGVNSEDYVNLGSLLGRFGGSEVLNIFSGIILILSGVAAGLILNRRLDRKSDWGIYIGMIITWLIPFLIALILAITGLY